MFKSWYSNFYNQFTKLNSGGSHNSNENTNGSKHNKSGKEFVTNEKMFLSSSSPSPSTNGKAAKSAKASLIPSKNSFKIGSTNGANGQTSNSVITLNSPNNAPLPSVSGATTNVSKLTRSPSSSTPTKVFSKHKGLNKSNSLSPKKISANRKFINTDVNSKCSMMINANGHHYHHHHQGALNDQTNLFFNTFQSLVHYGDNIGAKIVKCLINENLYESQSLINQDYDIYQVNI